MELNSTLATRLYQTMQGALKPNGPAPQPPPQQEGQQLFARTAASFVETLRAGETTAMSGMVGRADPHSVVAALASAEMAVQTAVTVRDKVVEAYQEILRMPV
ncbi:MAG: flagellar hook-basal body complex protein FliE [Pseudomonadota bacterium]